MTRTGRSLGAALWVILLALPAPPVARGQQSMSEADRQTLDQAASAISQQRIEDAERLLSALEQSLGEAPNRLFELSRLRFHQGRYGEALALVDQALAVAPDNKVTKRWRGFRELIAATLAVTGAYQTQSSRDGRYVVLYPEGKDGYLAGYTLEVLAAADDALEQAFGIRIPGPIRLEIYPSAETLAEVSSLTVEQIETTGTVALSKWNRLMITSPKALVRGYPWADTITHELVHMVLSRLTGDNAPVWLQEGTAKLFERSWRGPGDAGLLLDAASRGLLHAAKADGELLTFEQMHPSIAMLPSQDDAALAFAQVATFMERYLERFGRSALQAGLSQVRDGVDAREALAAAAGTPFSKLEGEWKASIPAAKTDAGDLHRLKKRFVEGETPPDESADVVKDEARRYLRVADLLWDRGRIKAAAIEYSKAHEADPDDPIVAARWARAALESGDPQSAVDSLAPQVERYPGHAPTHAVLGQALLLIGAKERARKELRESIWINPFDPDPHCALAQAAATPEEARREQTICEALR